MKLWKNCDLTGNAIDQVAFSSFVILDPAFPWVCSKSSAREMLRLGIKARTELNRRA